MSVGVGPVGKLGRPVSLKESKAESSLAGRELVRESRLSVAPVRDEEWAKVLGMSRA